MWNKKVPTVRSIMYCKETHDTTNNVVVYVSLPDKITKCPKGYMKAWSGLERACHNTRLVHQNIAHTTCKLFIDFSDWSFNPFYHRSVPSRKIFDIEDAQKQCNCAHGDESEITDTDSPRHLRPWDADFAIDFSSIFTSIRQHIPGLLDS